MMVTLLVKWEGMEWMGWDWGNSDCHDDIDVRRDGPMDGWIGV